ncbi:MAG: cytochrome C, partial [Deltaproteobacteria bacterium]|nr:cytochrome C [Deltaproteobacteria bacterium]
KKVAYPTTVAETRPMDCVDCHNRPTHVYAPSASVAIDQAMALGRVDPSIPFIKKEAMALMVDVKASRADADKRYVSGLQQVYSKKYPQVAKDKAKLIHKAGTELGRVYLKNIFPRMNIGWGTYLNHLGHRSTTEGCFRCHNDEHKTKEGKVLAQDCDLCHDVLADDEEKPDVPASLLKLGR